MNVAMHLNGEWCFLPDEESRYVGFPPNQKCFSDSIMLPNTTAIAKKGVYNEHKEIGCLTECYPYRGQAWYAKEISLPKDFWGKKLSLSLERTRATTLYVNGKYVGMCQSLCTPHVYDLSSFSTSPTLWICICVDNMHLPVTGGHMTSPDTQTNWNGILGEISLTAKPTTYISHAKIIPHAKERTADLILTIEGNLIHEKIITYGTWQTIKDTVGILPSTELSITRQADFLYIATLALVKNDPLLDEFSPIVCNLSIQLKESEDCYQTSFALTDFHTEGKHFYNHEKQVFLRGKHDGMIFPLTGAAPMDVEGWLHVMGIAKSYGINHYRFHTCCPPEAAFVAADLLGIYLSPELPFWGTTQAPNEEGYDPKAQGYLIAEGKRILDTFGNHPSFAMFSLGNELWGNPQRLGEILAYYKQEEKRILFTQGCNNFQHWPLVIDEDDFYVGVRLSKNRLIRGSYATCDIPLGFVQTERPNTVHSYDTIIAPDTALLPCSEDCPTEIEIQYGTGVKKVQISQSTEGLSPEIPIVTHEIGQYCTFPNFGEIAKYTGVLQARNFEVFKERLEEQDMLSLAGDFFLCSGKLAVQCYKYELEAALRSSHISGFQILDIQDFSGQGTALVGILDAFMDSKGLVTEEEWKEFCSETVVLALLDRFVFASGQRIDIPIQIRHHANVGIRAPLSCVLSCGEEILSESQFEIDIDAQGLFAVGTLSLALPHTDTAMVLSLSLCMDDVKNHYTLYLYPNQEISTPPEGVLVSSDLDEVLEGLSAGKRVLYLPQEIPNKIEGFYCTEFWCYPMFRGIAESMGKPLPVGTMGLLISEHHAALSSFPTEKWSTPQWYDIVSHSDLAILDGTPIQPIVQMIDNFERNHKLGLLFECRVDSGTLLVCTARLSEIADRVEVKQLQKSLFAYVQSEEFCPQCLIDVATVRSWFTK